jgi:exodeoxyribonuclease VII small subunit
MAPRSKRSELPAGSPTAGASNERAGGLAGARRASSRAPALPPSDVLAEEIDGSPLAPGGGAGSGPGVDALLADLERIVSELEDGDLPLEVALARFEAGIRLARRGGALLDALEQRVDVLLGGRIEAAEIDLEDAEDDDPGDPDDLDEDDADG